MTITFQRTNTKGRYRVKINGQPAGKVIKEDSTGKVFWLYECSAPRLKGYHRQRKCAVENAVLDVLVEASDLKDYLRL